MDYYIIQCKRCGQWRVSYGENIRTMKFKCFVCDRGSVIFSKNGVKRLNFRGPMGERESTVTCQSLNVRKRIVREGVLGKLFS